MPAYALRRFAFDREAKYGCLNQGIDQGIKKSAQSVEHCFWAAMRLIASLEDYGHENCSFLRLRCFRNSSAWSRKSSNAVATQHPPLFVASLPVLLLYRLEDADNVGASVVEH